MQQTQSKMYTHLIIILLVECPLTITFFLLKSWFDADQDTSNITIQLISIIQYVVISISRQDRNTRWAQSTVTCWEDWRTVLKKIAMWSLSAHHCCRNRPIAYCCHRQIKFLINKDKQPQPRNNGEVPDELFYRKNICLYEEGLEPMILVARLQYIIWVPLVVLVSFILITWP